MFVETNKTIMSKTTVTVTMNPETKEMGQKKAKEDDRSFSSYIEMLIKKDCQ